MWVPRDLEEIEAAVADGRLEETHSFDAKRELPATNASGNKSIAVDVAAMSTEGGTILYGIGEDENERLTVRNPIELAGTSDRIAQVVQSAIAEVPHIDFHTYPLEEDPSKGYLLVAIPASPRAPHQVTVGDDRRYYGRGARGNRKLGEQEVAQLYARRQERDVNLLARLDEVMRFAPDWESDDPEHGVTHAFAQPVPPDQQLWERAVEDVGGEDVLKQRIVSAMRAVQTRHGHDPSFEQRATWRRRGADEWAVGSHDQDPPPPNFVVHTVQATFNIDGRAVLISGNAAQLRPQHATDTEGRKMIFERVIAGNLAAFFAGVAALYDAAGYNGAVDVGVAVTGLAGGYSVGRFENNEPRFVDWDRVPRYDGPTFTRVRRVASVSELATDPQGVAMGLLGGLLAATTGSNNYTPFP